MIANCEFYSKSQNLITHRINYIVCCSIDNIALLSMAAACESQLLQMQNYLSKSLKQAPPSRLHVGVEGVQHLQKASIGGVTIEGKRAKRKN